MTQIDIVSGNMLIAEFMCEKWRVEDCYGETKPFLQIDNHKGYWIASNYASDWNALMRIVEKIGDMRIKSPASYNPDLMFRIEIVNGYTKIEGTGERIFANSSIEGSMILATWKAVIQFIIWYNTTKTNNP